MLPGFLRRKSKYTRCLWTNTKHPFRASNRRLGFCVCFANFFARIEPRERERDDENVACLRGRIAIYKSQSITHLWLPNGFISYISFFYFPEQFLYLIIVVLNAIRERESAVKMLTWKWRRINPLAPRFLVDQLWKFASFVLRKKR